MADSFQAVAFRAMSRNSADDLLPRALLCIGNVPPDPLLIEAARQANWALSCVQSVAAAARLIRPGTYRVALLLLDQFSAVNCEQVRHLICNDRRCEWVAVLTPGALANQACVDLVSGYFFDHYTLPVDYQGLMHTLEHALIRALMQDGVAARCAEAKENAIIGASAAIRSLLHQIGKVAATNAPVLIGGESGSGKELVAQAVHRLSPRHTAPFVAVNCGAIASSLVQAELFGAVKGAFTGALRDRKGLLATADKGTIFLDEIADLPLDMQTNLLRFLQEGTIMPVGSTTSLRLDVRVIAATNIDLLAAVKQGRFRSDLFYRLNVLPLVVPPLRERRDDIVKLAEYFFSQFSSESNPRLRGFSAAACRAMSTFDWPGNVRELINRVRRAIVMADGRMIMPADLGFATAPGFASVDGLGRIRIDAERIAVCEALAQARNNITQAARMLGISRMTLYRMIERHQLDLTSPEEILRQSHANDAP